MTKNYEGQPYKIQSALWEYQTTRRLAVGATPFSLKYRMEAALLVEIKFHRYRSPLMGKFLKQVGCRPDLKNQWVLMKKVCKPCIIYESTNNRWIWLSMKKCIPKCQSGRCNGKGHLGTPHRPISEIRASLDWSSLRNSFCRGREINR